MERRIIFIILLTLLLISCGGEEHSATEKKPVGRVVSSEYEPAQPTSITPINLKLTALAEKEPVYNWKVNGVVQEVKKSTLPPDNFSRGDTVVCEVLIDGKKEKTIGPIFIKNAKPHVKSIELVPDGPKKGTNISVNVEFYDPEGDEIEKRIAWFVNDEKVGEGNKLSGSKIKAGDRVYAEVRPFDGIEEGLPRKSNVITVQNTPPEINASMPAIKGRSIDYTINTSDKDGDSVSISLGDVPSGMSLEGNKLTWEAPEVEKDTVFKVEIIAEDENGGRTRETFNIKLRRKKETGSKE